MRARRGAPGGLQCFWTPHCARQRRAGCDPQGPLADLSALLARPLWRLDIPSDQSSTFGPYAEQSTVPGQPGAQGGGRGQRAVPPQWAWSGARMGGACDAVGVSCTGILSSAEKVRAGAGNAEEVGAGAAVSINSNVGYRGFSPWRWRAVWRGVRASQMDAGLLRWAAGCGVPFAALMAGLAYCIRTHEGLGRGAGFASAGNRGPIHPDN